MESSTSISTNSSRAQNRSKDSLVKSILNAAEGIRKVAINHGFQLAPLPPPMIEALHHSVPEDALEKINMGFTSYLDVVESAEPVIDLRAENRLLLRAMNRWGYRLADSVPGELEDYLEKEHLIELYDENGIQLYRNLEFFRYCSYSLLELALIDWTTLYERPTQINKIILDKIAEMFVTGEIVGSNQVPEHILRERYLSAKKAFLIKIKRLVPVVSDSGPVKKGFVSVMSANLIASGSEAVKIQYI